MGRTARANGQSKKPPSAKEALAIQMQQWLDEWKGTVRHLPAAQRETWLRQKGEFVLGKPRMEKLLAEIRADRKKVRDLSPTPAWSDIWYRTGQKLPVQVTALLKLAQEEGDRRDFNTVAHANGVGMVLSREATLAAEPGSTTHAVRGVARRRLLPKVAARMENQLDSMDAIEALFYEAPEKGRPLTVKDILAMGLKEHKRRLREGGEDEFACEWKNGTNKGMKRS